MLASRRHLNQRKEIAALYLKYLLSNGELIIWKSS
jgi:hypothetical protein